ncbi:MAG: 50S ribosomal protein L39e [Thaumarchaeota archaeon]|nr:50S ribosomal protein L39e [Candidatus Terraquivivens yellowstonensis]MCL7388141.1 50S ribosomal protein L39e [Candidatus Terraquivivens yellowstonensis]MCL7392788.1 50S ribosomal protein L39e [Candidatus Terraquivivens yellowstonensis]MCL7395717.1 50S ribosomal protein L39e [Candidatus Terraquivivens yellowstonensis]MCL7397557.1 50S ribosomal protein L39e [Candidatus Terraquivivens yellowstonensis]
MARTLPLKKRLARAMRRSWPVPSWVILRTARKVRTHERRRHWRTSRIKP